MLNHERTSEGKWDSCGPTVADGGKLTPSPIVQIFHSKMTRELALKDNFAPIAANPPSCILPATIATHFEIHLATISMLPSFHGFI